MKRYYRLIIYMIIIGLSIALILKGRIVLGLSFALLYYLLFGFVAIAFAISLFGNDKNVRRLTYLTFPYLLLPTEKAYYYFLKLTILIHDKEDMQSSLEMAQRINENNLSTDNDRSIVHFYQACLFFDLKEYQKAQYHLERAKAFSHKAILNDEYERIERLLTECSPFL